MSEGNGNKAWQIAFWIMTGLLVIGFSTIGSAVVSNDRIRQSEDKELRCEIDKTKEDFNCKIDILKDQSSQILVKVARIETLISKR